MLEREAREKQAAGNRKEVGMQPFVLYVSLVPVYLTCVCTRWWHVKVLILMPILMMHTGGP